MSERQILEYLRNYLYKFIKYPQAPAPYVFPLRRELLKYFVFWMKVGYWFFITQIRKTLFTNK